MASRHGSVTCVEKQYPYRWKEKKPKRPSQRAKMPDRCFLLPKERKFPVCSVKTNCYDCAGIQAAYKRALQGKTMRKRYRVAGKWNPDIVARKAIKLAKRIGCDWPRRSEL